MWKPSWLPFFIHSYSIFWSCSRLRHFSSAILWNKLAWDTTTWPTEFETNWEKKKRHFHRRRQSMKIYWVLFTNFSRNVSRHTSIYEGSHWFFSANNRLMLQKLCILFVLIWAAEFESLTRLSLSFSCWVSLATYQLWVAPSWNSSA